MDEHKKMATEQFVTFLNRGYDKKFVQDWLDLARLERISINSNDIKKTNEDKDALEILKFNAFFVTFNYLVRTYNFIPGKLTSEKRLEEEVATFVEQLTSNGSETPLKDYNPFERNDLYMLSKNINNDSLSQRVSDLFRKICHIHRDLFDNRLADTEIFHECNLILDDFFTRFQALINSAVC